jgi:hypothetical protein
MESMPHTSTDDQQKTDFAPLSCEALATVHGGVMRVMVDGRTPATMDELALNMEIFKGNIGGPMVLYSGRLLGDCWGKRRSSGYPLLPSTPLASTLSRGQKRVRRRVLGYVVPLAYGVIKAPDEFCGAKRRGRRLVLHHDGSDG